jgi:putative transposase
MFGCQQNLLNPSPELKAILEFLCSESAKLTNCGVYYSRQLFFKTEKIPSRADLHKEIGTRNQNKHYQAFYSDTAQQILTTVAESFKSYIGLLKGLRKGTVDKRPRLPGYRKGGLALVTYTGRSVRFKDGMLVFPLGTKIKAWFGIDSFALPMPSNLDYKNIREYRILPRNGCFYLEMVYKNEFQKAELDAAKVLGIDHGLNNWLTCLSNIGTSFIVDGLKLKSLNQFYNKQISNIKEKKPQGFWSKKLATITEKRNRQVRDAINKAARIVVGHCLANGIGTIVFGWNKGQKDGTDMGRKNNQKFVQIPTARLKDRIFQLCEQYGIQFVETEESYTSQASFLDSDILPVFGAKPEGWKKSGRHVSRGLYHSANGTKINADCNGAANIIRKVAVTLGLCLEGISSGALTSPLRVRIWAVQESPSL